MTQQSIMKIGVLVGTFSVFCILFCIACQRFNIPDSTAFLRISNEYYDIETNNCVNKSFNYYEILQKDGYDVQLIILTGYDEKHKPIGHMIVKFIDKDSKVHWLDPTIGKELVDLKGWTISPIPSWIMLKIIEDKKK